MNISTATTVRLRDLTGGSWLASGYQVSYSAVSGASGRTILIPLTTAAGGLNSAIVAAIQADLAAYLTAQGTTTTSNQIDVIA